MDWIRKIRIWIWISFCFFLGSSSLFCFVTKSDCIWIMIFNICKSKMSHIELFGPIYFWMCVCVSNWDWNKENSPIVNGFRHERQTRTLVNQSIIKCNKKLLWLLLFPIWSLNISCFCKNPHHSNAFKFDWFVINDCVV